MAASSALLDLLLGTTLSSCVSHRLSITLACHVTSEDGRSTLNLTQALDRVVSALVEPAQAPLFMGDVVIIEPVTTTIWTIYAEDIL